MSKQFSSKTLLIKSIAVLTSWLVLTWFMAADFACAQTTDATESQVDGPTRSIPFRLTRANNISVAAIVNNNFAVNLMFHTAADQVSLTYLTLKNLPEIELDEEVDVESWGGRSTTRFASGIPLSIGPVELGEITIFQSMHSGHQTDGKFGPRQLKSQFIEVDFDRSRLLLHDSLPEKTSNWERLGLTIENGMMFVEGNIHHGENLIQQRFMIHSGYSGFALLDDEFVAKHTYINELEIIDESVLTDSGGNKLKTKKSSLPHFSIGAIQFDDVPVSFFGGAMGRQKFSVLGGNFLKRFNLVVDLEDKALYLKKSRHFGIPQEHTTSGTKDFAKNRQLQTAQEVPSPEPPSTQNDIGIRHNLNVTISSGALVINPDVVIPKDDGKALISALNGFLESAQKPNGENTFVLDTERLETFVLLDEFKEVEKNGDLKDDRFYKPYLTNVVAMEDKYLIQVSYIGTTENTAFLRASFELVAHSTDGDSFLFSSPLVRNTKNWKVETIGDNVFHYQIKINQEKARQYGSLAALFDQKLKLKNKVTELYCCENLRELQKLIGVEYKADDNSRASGVYSSIVGDRKLVVLGNGNSSFEKFDPHDLWHDRLSLVIARRKVNQPIDEGCAYLYGGCWGESWEKILEVFNREIASDKEADWLEWKRNSKAFGNGYPRKFYVDHIANALLLEKIEREKGFKGVWEFLNCGPREKGDENYFRTLEKLTGITRENYNDKIWELVAKSSRE